MRFDRLLSGGDLRSLGNSSIAVLKINDQNDFEELFKFLQNDNRIIAMRAADVIEKITIQNPSYLIRHKNFLLELCNKKPI